MDLLDRLSTLRASVEGQYRALDSQKKTETVLVLPFFDALGYDPFDVGDVEPEVSVGDGEAEMTVDYALKKDERPVMLVQCTEAAEGLDVDDDHFLLRHLGALEADVVVFTNGLQYQFYVDATASPEAGRATVFEFGLLDFGPAAVETLRRFSKPAFDPDEVRAATYGSSYGQQVREYLARQTDDPDAPFVQFVAAQIHEGDVSDDALDRLRPVVRQVLRDLVGEAGADREGPKGRKERPVRPNEEAGSRDEERGDQGGTGVFEKDLVKRVLEDF